MNPYDPIDDGSGWFWCEYPIISWPWHGLPSWVDTRPSVNPCRQWVRVRHLELYGSQAMEFPP